MSLPKISRLFLFLVLLMSYGLPVCLAEERGASDFFEMAKADAYPGVYGDALDFFSKKYGNAGDDLLKAVSSNSEHFRQHISLIAAAIDAGGIPATKEDEKTALAAALTGLKALATTPDGKIFLSVYGLSPDMVNEGIALFQIWWDSAAALGKNKIGPILFAMQGSIEHDPTIMNPHRETDQGDAAVATREIQNYLWEKVTANSQWRDLFMVYMTEDLQKEGPQPVDWQQWALARDIAEDEKSLQKKEECQKNLAGLLTHIDRLAEAEKQRAMARRAVAVLKRKFAGPSHFSLALKKYAEAVRLLPEVHAFALKCPDMIREGKENNHMDPLQEVIRTSREYAEKALWHIPARGRYAAERNSLLDQFRRYYYQAKDAYSLLSSAYEQKMLKEADRTEPPEWTAKRYPFTMTFEQIQGQARQEYLDTGTAGSTKKNIKEAYSKILKQYETDYDAVKNEALKAMSTASDSSFREAYISFSSQWAYYKSADVQAFTELTLLIDEYLETLSLVPSKNLETAMQGGEGMDGVEQIAQRVEYIENAGVFALESEIEKFCLAQDRLPETGYVSLQKLKFSPNSDDVVMKSQADANAITAVEPAMFFEAYGRQVSEIRSGVSGALMAANPCASGNGTVPLSELISNTGRILAMMETVWELKGAMDEIRNNISALTDFIHRAPMPKNRVPELEARIDGIRQVMEKCKKVEDKIRTLKPVYITGRGRYIADLHHIENDLFFLDQLHKNLLAQPDAFSALRAGYTYRPAPVGAGDGSYFIFKSGMASPWSCDKAQSAPVLMTKKEIKQQIAQFHEQQNASGIYALDAAYGLNIRKYTDNYIEKSLAIGRPYTPENYLYLNIDKECVFFPKEYFDALAKHLADIPVNAPGRFNENLQRAFSKTKYYPPEKLFRVPYETLSGKSLPAAEKVDVKIFSDLEAESKKNWNAPARASLKKAADLLKKKRNAYADWKSKESHFWAVWKRFEGIQKRFTAAESKANAVDMKAAEKQGILELYKAAAAMEPEIIAFAEKTGADPGLSEQRRSQVLKHISDLKQRLQSIKEMILSLSPPKPAASGTVPQASKAAG